MGKSRPATAWIIQGGSLQNHAWIGPTRISPLTLPVLKSLSNSIGAEVVFVLNLLSSKLESQMQMLREAHNIGISIKYVELGNELYFPEADFVQPFPTAGAYGS